MPVRELQGRVEPPTRREQRRPDDVQPCGERPGPDRRHGALRRARRGCCRREAIPRVVEIRSELHECDGEHVRGFESSSVVCRHGNRGDESTIGDASMLGEPRPQRARDAGEEHIVDRRPCRGACRIHVSPRHGREGDGPVASGGAAEGCTRPGEWPRAPAPPISGAGEPQHAGPSGDRGARDSSRSARKRKRGRGRVTEMVPPCWPPGRCREIGQCRLRVGRESEQCAHELHPRCAIHERVVQLGHHCDATVRATFDDIELPERSGTIERHIGNRRRECCERHHVPGRVERGAPQMVRKIGHPAIAPHGPAEPEWSVDDAAPKGREAGKAVRERRHEAVRGEAVGHRRRVKDHDRHHMERIQRVLEREERCVETPEASDVHCSPAIASGAPPSTRDLAHR